MLKVSKSWNAKVYVGHHNTKLTTYPLILPLSAVDSKMIESQAFIQPHDSRIDQSVIRRMQWHPRWSIVHSRHHDQRIKQPHLGSQSHPLVAKDRSSILAKCSMSLTKLAPSSCDKKQGTRRWPTLLPCWFHRPSAPQLQSPSRKRRYSKASSATVSPCRIHRGPPKSFPQPSHVDQRFQLRQVQRWQQHWCPPFSPPLPPSDAPGGQPHRFFQSWQFLCGLPSLLWRLSQVGVKIKNVWNHHLVMNSVSNVYPVSSTHFNPRLFYLKFHTAQHINIHHQPLPVVPTSLPNDPTSPHGARLFDPALQGCWICSTNNRWTTEKQVENWMQHQITQKLLWWSCHYHKCF